MNNHVVIFEARGGTDKGKYGYRKDTKPIVDSLQKRGWTAEVVFYSDAHRGEIYRHVVEQADAYISRINPGNLKDETGYFQMLRELVQQGVAALPHPDVMIYYGAKNAVEQLKATKLVPDDVYTYYDLTTLKEQFPKTLALGERVLKQNRGSTGEGIWRVELLDSDEIIDGLVNQDAMVKLTEARDNHTETKTLGEFLDFCSQYLEGDSGLVLDMPFLPRIKEGEIRLLMLRDTVVNVVHKKPADTPDAFSATLFSGAEYRYDKPEEWPELKKLVESNVQLLQEQLGGYDLPLIWTMDFILDTCPKTGSDKYVLGEINASCVGFTTHLDLSENIADEILHLLDADNIVNRRWGAYKV